MRWWALKEQVLFRWTGNGEKNTTCLQEDHPSVFDWLQSKDNQLSAFPRHARISISPNAGPGGSCLFLHEEIEQEVLDSYVLAVSSAHVLSLNFPLLLCSSL